MVRVAVVGASGFVGSAVARSLGEQGHEAIVVRAPRICSNASSVLEVVRDARQVAAQMPNWADGMRGVHAVINAAGCASASSADRAALAGANAVLPRLVSEAIGSLGTSARFVHISSAAVQGANPLTEEPRTEPFSPYSWSKALGEWSLPSSNGIVLYRPTSVHGVGRRTTESVVRLARSRVSSVAGDGDRPTPQTLVENVGNAAAYLATTERQPPRVVLHPWEGLTTASFLTVLGGHEPRRIPVALAQRIVRAGIRVGRYAPSALANSRRLELLWFGQPQDASWLVGDGWRPPFGPEGWERLSTVVEKRKRSSE